MTKKIRTIKGIPAGADVTFSVSQNGSTPKVLSTPVGGWGSTPSGDVAASIPGGRVSILDAPFGDETAFAITAQPTNGRATVTQDKKLAVILTEAPTFSGVDTVEVSGTSAANGAFTGTYTLTVAAATEEKGWSIGDHYLLEEDANYRTIVEHGDAHRKMYVSTTGLSKADIAALEGISEGSINKYWLAAHPEYGGTPEMALQEFPASECWTYINEFNTNSNWLLFKRGETFTTGFGFPYASKGESPLHPIFIGAYGTGADPVFTGVSFQGGLDGNFVAMDLSFKDGARFSFGSYTANLVNLLVDGFSIYGNGNPGEGNASYGSSFTLKELLIVDVWRPIQDPPAAEWYPLADRIQGFYASNATGIYMVGTFFDHNGFADGWDFVDRLTPPDGSLPHAPSMYSHNMYVQDSTWDVTFRDNFNMRGASHGAQFRGGAHIDGNFFLDNNIGLNFLGGNYMSKGPIKCYSYVADNVITSAGHRDAYDIGAIALGWSDQGTDSTRWNNIIAHLADPNNETEFNAKYDNNAAIWESADPPIYFYDDTVIYNWLHNSYDFNTDVWATGSSGPNYDVAVGLGKTVAELNAVTGQKWIDDYLSTSGSVIGDISTYIRAQFAAGNKKVIREAAKHGVNFFQTGFGIAPAAPSTFRFVPSELTEGMRWDVRRNWSDLAIPTAGSSVYLDGYKTYYATMGTLAIAALDFGLDGILDIRCGKLTVTALSSTGTVEISNAGQFWVPGGSQGDLVTFNVTQGRFANSGVWTGAIDLTISDGQALLAYGDASFTLASGSTLTIETSLPKVGFDGAAGSAQAINFAVGSTLEFVCDATGVSGIGEFRSGRLLDVATATSSTITISGGTLSVDVTALTATGTFVLMSADALTGDFDTVAVPGLGGSRDATVNVNETTDEVTLTIAAGTGVVSHTHTP